ncbi:MAG: AmmeMemoRadiSam system protein B [Patescibacteria group bacterium]
MGIREPNVAGQFYPASREELIAELERCFHDAADAPLPLQSKKIKALIAPHAGYVYSGVVAASAYQLLERPYRRVILLGPSHYMGFDALALDEADGWRTPLGEVELDRETITKLSKNKYYKVFSEAFAREHSLEVQLPFLQKQLRSFKLVPLCCGQELAYQLIAGTLNTVIDADTLVVASSDLSHYQPQHIAAKKDRATIDAVLSRDPDKMKTDVDACGSEGIMILNELARLNGWQPHLVDYRTSAEASGDESAVVGYGGIVYF